MLMVMVVLLNASETASLKKEISRIDAVRANGIIGVNRIIEAGFIKNALEVTYEYWACLTCTCCLTCFSVEDEQPTMFV